MAAVAASASAGAAGDPFARPLWVGAAKAKEQAAAALKGLPGRRQEDGARHRAREERRRAAQAERVAQHKVVETQAAAQRAEFCRRVAAEILVRRQAERSKQLSRQQAATAARLLAIQQHKAGEASRASTLEAANEAARAAIEERFRAQLDKRVSKDAQRKSEIEKEALRLRKNAGKVTK
jgi:hypothetical protein